MSFSNLQNKIRYFHSSTVPEESEYESKSENSEIEYQNKVHKLLPTFDTFTNIDKRLNRDVFLRQWYTYRYNMGTFSGRKIETEMSCLGLAFPILDENFKVLKWVLPYGNSYENPMVTFKVLSGIVAIPFEHMDIFFWKMKFLSQLNGIDQQLAFYNDFFYFRPENPRKIFLFRSIHRKGYITTTYTVEDINGEDVVLNCPADFNRLILVKVERRVVR